jgi:hypothetical protein
MASEPGSPAGENKGGPERQETPRRLRQEDRRYEEPGAEQPISAVEEIYAHKENKEGKHRDGEAFQ